MSMSRTPISRSAPHWPEACGQFRNEKMIARPPGWSGGPSVAPGRSASDASDRGRVPGQRPGRATGATRQPERDRRHRGIADAAEQSQRTGPWTPDPTRCDPSSTWAVAVNGRPSGWQTLDWATAESAALRSALRIVHVINWPLPTLDARGGSALTWCATDAPEHGARILDEAARRARLIAPDTTISTHLEVGPLAAAVRKAARGDALIVVGRGRTKPLAFHSPGWRIARRACGPVALVELDDEPRTGPAAGRVVVGIDDTAGPPPAVVYAFHAASRRGVGLTVIHASTPWTDPPI